jgi:hypothetical protein
VIAGAAAVLGVFTKPIHVWNPLFLILLLCFFALLSRKHPGRAVPDSRLPCYCESFHNPSVSSGAAISGPLIIRTYLYSTLLVSLD